jgi:hypothetical protein
MKTFPKILIALMLLAAGCSKDKAKDAIPGTAPAEPTELSQTYKDWSTRLPWGGLTGEDAVILGARVSADPADLSVRLHVEVVPLGMPWSGQPTATSGFVSSGQVAAVWTPLSQDGPTVWRAWTEDSYGRSSPMATPLPGTAFIRDSSVPTGPLQSRLGGTPTIPVGGETTDLGLDLSAQVRSLAGNMLRAQFEVQPLGTPFDGTNVGLGLFVASGSVSHAVVMVPPGSLHWRVRAEDLAGGTSPWLTFGGNDDLQPEPADVVRVAPGDVSTPTLPGALGQYYSDTVTPIPNGGQTSEDKVVLSGSVLWDGHACALEVEVKGAVQAFDGTSTILGTFVQGGLSRAAVPLSAGSWHWRARTTDSEGTSSDWTTYSGAPLSTDFTVVPGTNNPPSVPTSLAQYQSNGWEGMTVGEALNSASMIVQADLADADLGDGLVLEVEVKLQGVPFVNLASASSGVLSSGSTAKIQLDNLTPGAVYHWQARALDQAGATSAWVEYTGSTPSQEPPPSSSGGGTGSSAGGGGGGCGGTVAVPHGSGLLPLALFAAALVLASRRPRFRGPAKGGTRRSEPIERLRESLRSCWPGNNSSIVLKQTRHKEKNVMKCLAFILAVVLASSAAGCTFGTRFEAPSYESIILKETTRQEILNRFGTPLKEGKLLKQEQMLNTVSYAMATGGGVALGHGGLSVIPSRAMAYFFLDDRVIAFRFLSSYEEDHTDFDDTKVPTIKKGETTKDQVIALLGPPRGKCVYPFIPGKDDEGIIYAYRATWHKAFGGTDTYAKDLTVSIGPDGKVTNVEFSTMGER